MNFDGTYTYDMVTNVDLTNEVTSDKYSDKVVALTNCPAKTTICGTKELILQDYTSEPVTLKTASLDPEVDSCHWLVKAQCDVPEIAISKELKASSTDYSILVVEWSINSDPTGFEANTVDYIPKNMMSYFVEDAAMYYPATLPPI